MPAGCNCGPNSLLAQALGCHCVRRGTSHCQSAATSEVVKVPLFRIVTCKWRYINWASFTLFYLLPDRLHLLFTYRPKHSIRQSSTAAVEYPTRSRGCLSSSPSTLLNEQQSTHG